MGEGLRPTPEEQSPSMEGNDETEGREALEKLDAAILSLASEVRTLVTKNPVAASGDPELHDVIYNYKNDVISWVRKKLEFYDAQDDPYWGHLQVLQLLHRVRKRLESSVSADDRRSEAGRLALFGGVMGREVESFALSDLLSSTSGSIREIYFQTGSGNIYCIYRIASGQYALADARGNSGVGRALRGTVVPASVLRQAVLELGRSLAIGPSFRTTEVTAILAVEDGNQVADQSVVASAEQDLRRQFLSTVGII
jgi:hypothetical protein